MILASACGLAVYLPMTLWSSHRRGHESRFKAGASPAVCLAQHNFLAGNTRVFGSSLVQEQQVKRLVECNRLEVRARMAVTLFDDSD